MSDFDTVLERLISEPSFAAALAADPAGALAGYRLTADELALLHSQVGGDTGGQTAVETRANQSSVFGMLTPLAGLGGLADAVGLGQPGAGSVGHPISSGLDQPGLGQPELSQPELTQPGLGQSGLGQAGFGQSGIGQAGIGQAGIGQAGFGEATGFGEAAGIGQAVGEGFGPAPVAEGFGASAPAGGPIGEGFGAAGVAAADAGVLGGASAGGSAGTPYAGGGGLAGLGDTIGQGLSQAPQGGSAADVPHLPPPEGYHTRVDVDGDGHWDRHTLHGRADGGVDIHVDLNRDGQVDFVGRDDDADGLVDSAAYDKNHDGFFEKRMYDDGDGWLDRSVTRRPPG